MTEPLFHKSLIHQLEERYPFFDTHEIQILMRCHESLSKSAPDDDFLLQMALASPYAHFFLPGDEMKDRIGWIEKDILPTGFAKDIESSVSIDVSEEESDDTHLMIASSSASLERFIEDVADAGGFRGKREAFHALCRLSGKDSSPNHIIQLAISLAVADEALMAPNLDKEAAPQKAQKFQPLIDAMTQEASLYLQSHTPSDNTFLTWMEKNFPLLTAPLSSFVHHLLFHEHPSPRDAGVLPFQLPILDKETDVFVGKSANHLMALSFMKNDLGGPWHRVYSSNHDGRSFNRLEWSLLGYGGPTMLVATTRQGATIGAFTTVPWKETNHFYGSPDCFLVELDPRIRVHRPVGGEDHFMFLYSSKVSSDIPESQQGQEVAYGLGFGGSLEKPRFFIPETLEHCSADFMDKTFEPGDLLPPYAMERFEILHLEVWGVGGSQEVIDQALRARAKHREMEQATLERARTIQDRTIFAHDLQSGLVLNHLFDHQKDVRGRQDFRVDDKHGGYVVEK